jgi:outer membrane protein assembly factor BamA
MQMSTALTPRSGRRRRLRPCLILVLLLSALGYGVPYARADRTLVPLPIFTTAPNEGETYGALMAIVDEQAGTLRFLLVPQVMWNSLLGFRAAGYYQRLLTPTEYYTLFASQSTRNQAHYQATYTNTTLAQGRYFFDGKFDYKNDRTARFFGLGADSRKQDETNYTLRDIGGSITLGRWIMPTLRFSLTERLHRVDIDRGLVSALPFIRDKFPGLPGANGAFVWAHRFALTYDSRDAYETPTRGYFGQLFVEAAERALGSQATFVRYGLEGRLLWPLVNDRLVTAMRGLVERVEGTEVPFFEQSALGGDDTLRGFGDDRFRDTGRILLSLEERIRLFALTYRGIRTAFELALFTEAGRVFHTFSTLDTRNVQTVVGTGVRLVVTSQIVAKIDVGLGSEGTAVFAGLHYPF